MGTYQGNLEADCAARPEQQELRLGIEHTPHEMSLAGRRSRKRPPVLLFRQINRETPREFPPSVRCDDARDVVPKVSDQRPLDEIALFGIDVLDRGQNDGAPG